jgi:hypothetical protein
MRFLSSPWWRWQIELPPEYQGSILDMPFSKRQKLGEVRRAMLCKQADEEARNIQPFK